MSLTISSDGVASIQARPDAFLRVLANLGTDPAAIIRAALPAAFASLSLEGCAAVFACLVAYNFTPVGNTATGLNAPDDPEAVTFDATLQELTAVSAFGSERLCKLTALLSLLRAPRLIPPDSGSKATVHFLVWNDSSPLGAGAYYTQLVLSNVLESAYLLLDPTYAVAASIPFSQGPPASNQSVVQNLASLLQTPLAMENVTLLNPGGSPDPTELVNVLSSAQLSPQDINEDPSFGSAAWDSQIANTFLGMG